MRKTDLAIIGSGLASVNLIKELRKAGDDRHITVITQEAGHFYSKPMLSNALSKSKTPSSLPVQMAEAFAAQYQVTLLPQTRVTRLDVSEKALAYCAQADADTESSTQTLSWGQLVLAMGAEPVSLAQVGATVSAPVYTVNQLSEYEQFYTALTQLIAERGAAQTHVGIVGSGLIGCEFANDLANQGVQVSVLDVADRPMARLLPPALSQALGSALSDLGVRWYGSQTVSQVHVSSQALTIETREGLTLPVDLVLSAIGLRPNVAVAEAAGLACGPGVQVDQTLRTSHPDVFALGDCATVAGVSLQYVLPLMACARALAKTLCGSPTPVQYPAMPVVVKTPACPTVVAIPPDDLSDTQWQISGDGADLKALLLDAQDQLLGFALMGKAVAEKNTLAKDLPAWLPVDA